MQINKNIYVTIKATLKCNLACQYCYGRDNHAQGKQMSVEEIRSGLDFVCEYASKVGAQSLTLCWHGGEPFLLANQLPQLIDYANNIFSKKNILIEHGTQTNATLLLPSTFEMIRKYFLGYVGVSIDLFSRFRTFPNGKTSTDIAIQNLDNALKAGIRCGAINLITQDNLNRIDDIYAFYKKRHMNVRLARVFPIDNDDTLSGPMYVSDEDYANALIRYFDLWANDPNPANNTDIVKLIGDLLLGRPSICLRENNCHQRYLALSPGGELYSCAEFDAPDSIIGNFLTQTPDEFILSDAREKLAKKAPAPDACRFCRYERICHGGCFRERFMLGYPYRCKSNILYWDHIVDWLKNKKCILYMLHDKSPQESRAILSQLFNIGK